MVYLRAVAFSGQRCADRALRIVLANASARNAQNERIRQDARDACVTNRRCASRTRSAERPNRKAAGRTGSLRGARGLARGKTMKGRRRFLGIAGAAAV